jgi:hypothetical protein
MCNIQSVDNTVHLLMNQNATATCQLPAGTAWLTEKQKQQLPRSYSHNNAAASDIMLSNGGGGCCGVWLWFGILLKGMTLCMNVMWNVAPLENTGEKCIVISWEDSSMHNRQPWTY